MRLPSQAFRDGRQNSGAFLGFGKSLPSFFETARGSFRMVARCWSCRVQNPKDCPWSRQQNERLMLWESSNAASRQCIVECFSCKEILHHVSKCLGCRQRNSNLELFKCGEWFFKRESLFRIRILILFAHGSKDAGTNVEFREQSRWMLLVRPLLNLRHGSRSLHT